MSLNSTPADPCPVEYYSTSPDQLSPWKVWMMAEAARQNIIGTKNNTVHDKEGMNTSDLSAYVEELMKNADVSDAPCDSLMFFWNLSAFQRQLLDLKAAFPDHFFHTIATKSNPLQRIIEAAAEVGVGSEAASLGEMQMALKTQPPHRVILDSPAKTMQEIEVALKAGVSLTIDNFQELARVEVLLKKLNLTPASTQCIGMRMNPQIGTGKLATYSVSKPWGKFGLPLNEVSDDVIAVYRQRPWMNMLHVHAGSQSYSMEQIASAIASIVKTAKLINEAVRGPVPADATPAQRREVNQIKTIDIGGGLCTNFDSEANTPSFADWRKVLEDQCPDLFTGEFHVITELGRRLLAKQGVLVSKIEYVKQCGGRRVVLQHAGADVCVRTVYKPDSWPLRATAFAAAGNALHPVPEAYGKGELLYADIAGPCCIDDVLAPQLRPLPEVAQNDYIMLHDTGAYYHSAFSYYNMRMFPALYAFYEPEHWHTDATKLEEKNVDGKDVPASNGEVKFELIRPTASLEDVMEFFVTKPPKGN